MTGVLRARDLLALHIRADAERRYREVERRSDLEAIGRLLAAAHWIEALPWDGHAAQLLAAMTPTLVEGPWPSKRMEDLLRQWRRASPRCRSTASSRS